jgi:hypothetical protein
VHAIIVSMSFHRACHAVYVTCVCGARASRMCMYMYACACRERERERERERGATGEREREERERRERGQHGRATSSTARSCSSARPGWARDAGGSDTALWDVNLNPNARGPSDHKHLGRRLQRGGAPRQFLATASPDPRVVRRGHSSFPPQRAGSSAVSAGGTDPRQEPRARSVRTRRTAAGWAGASSGG